MAKIKYREFLENLTNELGYTPAHSKLSEILGGEVSANALSNRYSLNGNIRPDEAEKITDFYRNKNRLGKEGEKIIMLDYYPSVFGSCFGGVFTPAKDKEKTAVPFDAFFVDFDQKKHYSIVTMKGNTMEPFIYEGDRIIVEHYEGGQIIDNKPYICCYNEEFYVRRLAKNVNQLVIMPENKLYDIIKLTKDDTKDVTIIGQIVGLMRNLR